MLQFVAKATDAIAAENMHLTPTGKSLHSLSMSLTVWDQTSDLSRLQVISNHLKKFRF